MLSREIATDPGRKFPVSLRTVPTGLTSLPLGRARPDRRAGRAFRRGWYAALPSEDRLSLTAVSHEDDPAQLLGQFGNWRGRDGNDPSVDIARMPTSGFEVR